MLSNETFQKAMNLYLNCFTLLGSTAFGASAELKQRIKAKHTEIAGVFIQKKQMIQDSLPEAFCQKGITLVEKSSSSFKLPKLTEKLSEKDLDAYLALLSVKNPQFMKMWKELIPWADAEQFKRLLQPK